MANAVSDHRGMTNVLRKAGVLVGSDVVELYVCGVLRSLRDSWSDAKINGT